MGSDARSLAAAFGAGATEGLVRRERQVDGFDSFGILCERRNGEWSRLQIPSKLRARAVRQARTDAQLVIENRRKAPTENRIHQLNRYAIAIGPGNADIANRVKSLRRVRLVN